MPQQQTPGAAHAATETARWFDDRGWDVHLRGDSPYCFADESVHLSTTIRRVAHSPLAAVRRVLPAPSILVMMQAEGETTVRTRDGRDHRVEEGGVLVCAQQNVVALSADTSSARVEVELPAEIATFELPDSMVLTAPADASRAVVTLSAVVISRLNIAPRTSPAVDLHLQSAIAGLVASIVNELVVSGIPPASDEAQNLLARALALFDARAGWHGVTVQSLASELGVTPRHLARTFRIAFASPKAALTARRSLAAQLLLAGDPNASLSSIARASGFPSANALRYHLTRTTEGPERRAPRGGEFVSSRG
ncbi:helix-turn-helix domain-containing protein [Microbacterium sp. HMH0099]|uniref:AraC family transcriptional regulator n=1 Tax=Microbacterium sp. HMH0099 TaxID=3414026 RepID=UPI003BF6EA58